MQTEISPCPLLTSPPNSLHPYTRPPSPIVSVRWQSYTLHARAHTYGGRVCHASKRVVMVQMVVVGGPVGRCHCRGRWRSRCHRGHVIWLYNMLSFWRSLARKNHLAWQKYERSIHKNCHQDDISLNHLPLCIFYAHFKSSWSPPTLQYEFESCRYPNLPSTYLG